MDSWSSLLRGVGHQLSPIEIKRAIVREVADKAQHAGNGEYIFPYSTVTIEVFARHAGDRAALEAVLERSSLHNEIVEELKVQRCKASTIGVELQVLEDYERLQKERYRISYYRRPGGAQAQKAPRPPALLRVVKGKANCNELPITKDEVNIGRLQDVVTRAGKRTRRNDLFFDESLQVSRLQASIVYDGEKGWFRLRDGPNTTSKTRILRDGTEIDCDTVRGAQLRSGDQIIFADICLGFESR